jgi:hypothetical protein
MSDLIDRLMRIESSGDPGSYYRNPDGPDAVYEIKRLREMLRELAHVNRELRIEVNKLRQQERMDACRLVEEAER